MVDIETFYLVFSIATIHSYFSIHSSVILPKKLAYQSVIYQKQQLLKMFQIILAQSNVVPGCFYFLLIMKKRNYFLPLCRLSGRRLKFFLPSCSASQPCLSLKKISLCYAMLIDEYYLLLRHSPSFIWIQLSPKLISYTNIIKSVNHIEHSN